MLDGFADNRIIGVRRCKNDRVPDNKVAHYIKFIEGFPVGFTQYWIAAPDSFMPPPCVAEAVILKEHRRHTFTPNTFVLATQLGHRMDERGFIRKLLINRKL